MAENGNSNSNRGPSPSGFLHAFRGLPNRPEGEALAPMPAHIKDMVQSCEIEPYSREPSKVWLRVRLNTNVVKFSEDVMYFQKMFIDALKKSGIKIEASSTSYMTASPSLSFLVDKKQVERLQAKLLGAEVQPESPGQAASFASKVQSIQSLPGKLR